MTEPVDIEFRINDQELAQASRRAVDSILGINSAGEQTIKTLRNQISEQKRLIREIESEIKGINKKASKRAPGSAQSELYTEAHYAKRALDEEKAALKGLETQLNTSAVASKRLTTTKRELVEQMGQLKLAGQQDTEEFRQLAEQAGTVERAIREVNKQTTLLGKADSNFQGLINGASGLAGVFSAGAGAMALFGGESKDLQQVQTRLQALMAITIGLQQAYNTLSKESAFQTVTVVKAKQMWASAQKVLNAQLGIGIGLSKALMVSGIGLLIVGIAALVKVYDDWKKKQAEVNRIQEEFRNIEVETAKAMADQSVKVKTLISVAENYNNSLKSRNEALRQLKEIMPGYNGYIDKEGALIANTDEALKSYLATLYKVEKAKKIFSDITKTQGEIEETSRKGVGVEDISFIDKLKVAGLNIFNPERGARDWQTAFEKRTKETVDILKKQEESLEANLKELLQDDTVFKALFPDSKYESQLNKAGIDGNKLKSETADRLAAIKEAQEKIKQQEYQNELDSRQEQIKLMDDGAEKVRAQIALDYDKRLAEIARKGDEMVKAQQEVERKIWEVENPKAKEKGDVFSAKTTSVDQLSESKKRGLGDDAFIAGEARDKKEDELNKQLLEKYQDYAAQRLAIEKQFDTDLDELRTQRAIAEKEGNETLIKQYDSAIAKLTKDKGKELISFDFDIFKKSPEYVRAFEDLKNVSTETLESLITQLEAYKESASASLDPTELREFSATLQEAIDEFAIRDPFKALTDSTNRLTAAKKKLIRTERDLINARKAGDPEKQKKAEEDYREALDETAKASNDVEKAQKKVSDVIGQLLDAISGVGDAIGGTTGEIINFIADIGQFVLTTAEGMKTTSETASKTVAMIEKASAILFIIQMAIQLIGKLQGFLKDSHQQYLDYSKEVAQINALRDAVNEYEIAVIKARQTQESWFGSSGLNDLKKGWELNGKYAESYFEKVNETQAKYVNEKGGGWWNNWGKAVLETTTKFAHGDTLGGLEAYNRNKAKYEKETVRAVDNLRIETKKKTSGVLGIGGKSQKTDDLRVWAKANGFGELFDEKGVIDTSVAKAILKASEDGVITLVGETKKTLEALVEYQDLYKQYQEQLQEYVSNLYSPLVDNFIDAMWDWYDNGTNALDSFKEYAAGTFRSIVSEMVRSIILTKLFEPYAEEIAKLYEKYTKGQNPAIRGLYNHFMNVGDETKNTKEWKNAKKWWDKNFIFDEKDLGGQIAEKTKDLMTEAETAVPFIENLLGSLTDSFKEIGIDISKPEGSSQQAERGSFQTMSQDTGSELLGQFTAIRIHTSNIHELIKGLEKEDKDIYNHLALIEQNTHDTVSELREVNTRLKRIETEGMKLK